MIHILTVHLVNPQFARIQASMIREWVGNPCRVRCFWDRMPIPPPPGYEAFTSNNSGRNIPGAEDHANKLNALTEIVLTDAKDDDIVIFMDGDCWPIRPLMPYLEEKLKDYPLLAVRRDELKFAAYPHPCFTATTAGFLRAFRIDWRCAKNLTPEDFALYGTALPDVVTYPAFEERAKNVLENPGGVLWFKLKRAGVDWYPVLRTNFIDIHALFLGVYGDIVFHVGAGFRNPGCPLDWEKCRVLDVSRKYLDGHNRFLLEVATKQLAAGIPLWNHLMKGGGR